jgi:hypothetical protein
VGNELKGIGGWLIIFLIGLIISPIYGIYLSSNPESFTNTGFIIQLVIGIYGFYVISLLISKDKNAIKITKEYLIFSLVINSLISFSLFLFLEYSEFIGSLLNAVVYFAIWFSYFETSKRVKNTYDTQQKINWKFLLIASLAIFALFYVGISMEVENDYEESINLNNLDLESNPTYLQTYKKTEWFNSNYAIYYPLDKPTTIPTPVNYQLDSDYNFTYYFVNNEEDFNNFINGKDFDYYSTCWGEGSGYYRSNCNVTSGGLIIYNTQDFDIKINIEFF